MSADASFHAASLRKVANEARKRAHHHWANTCEDAAEEIDALYEAREIPVHVDATGREREPPHCPTCDCPQAKTPELISSPYEHDRRILPYILNERGLLGIGVEVGVCQGIFAEFILQNWRGRVLYLVDPWALCPDYHDAPYDHEANYAETVKRMQVFADRYRICRMTSLEAASGFEDASLDFVYLDANHSYESVRADLRAWYPKVRQGGMLAGDDYGVNPEQTVDFGLGNGSYTFGVKRAVDEFALEYQKNISIDWLANWNFTVFEMPSRAFPARNWWLIR